MGLEEEGQIGEVKKNDDLGRPPEHCTEREPAEPKKWKRSSRENEYIGNGRKMGGRDEDEGLEFFRIFGIKQKCVEGVSKEWKE
jgi:hypothetical protein